MLVVALVHTVLFPVLDRIVAVQAGLLDRANRVLNTSTEAAVQAVLELDLHCKITVSVRATSTP